MTEVIRFALLGLGLGGIYALLALSVVVVHRGSGVLNFAAGAVGMVGAYTFYRLWDDHGLPWPVALVLALGLCALIGVLIHLLVMRPLDRAPATSRIVATLGVMAMLMGGATLIYAPEGGAIAVGSLLPAGQWDPIPDATVGIDRILLALIAVGVTLVLGVLRSRTRFGLATTAVAESKVRAAAFGWSPELIAGLNWALGCAIAGVACIGAAPFASLDVISLSLLVVPALAAALLGRFESVWLTLAGGLVIGIAVSEVGRYVTAPGWPTAAPLLLIVAVLVLRGRSLPSKAESTGRLPLVGAGALRPAGTVALALGVLAVLTMAPDWLQATTSTLIAALVVLSVVVVSGFAGQLSLAQVSLAGIGALLTAWLTIELKIALWGAIPLAAVMTVPIGMLVAVPALRTRGSNLAIATLALAVAINSVVLTSPTFTTSLIGPPMGPLELFGHDVGPIDNPRAFAIVCLVCLAIALRAVANVRRGATGRRMLAVRANERAAAALGISVSGTKLYAFGLGALFAAAAGALTQAQFPVADFSSYSILASINSVLQAVIGGIAWPSGAVLGATGADGALAAYGVAQLSAPSAWVLIGTGLLGILVVVFSPNGLVAYGLAVAVRLRLRGTSGTVAGIEPLSQELRQQLAAARVAPAQLTVSDVSVRFGGQLALDGVSLELRTGEVVGLIGANGAGKSTLIEVVTGFQPVSEGSVALDGQRLDGMTPSQRARRGVGRSFQALELFEDMSVVENLRAATDPCPPSRYLTDLAVPVNPPLTTSARQVIDDFELGSILDRTPQQLNYGARRVVAIARTLAASPSLVLLDEPAAGLGDTERRELATLIRYLSESRGVGVLLVEHDVELLFSVCDRIVALDAGRVIARGTPEEVRTNPAVIAAYLGADDGEAELVTALGTTEDRR